MLLAEETSDEGPVSLNGSRDAPNISGERLMSLGTLPRTQATFQDVVEAFIRVQFRSVGRQEEKTDLVAILLDPRRHAASMMRTDVVEHNEYRSCASLYETLQEGEENARCQRPFEYHESERPLRGHG